MSKKDYWQHKLSVYLHDPPHKCFSIQKHEQWATEIAETLGCSIADKELYKNADSISAGLTRAALPGYDANKDKNGAIAVGEIKQLVITNPVVKSDALKMELPQRVGEAALQKELLTLLGSDAETLPPAADDEERAKQLFFYLHFAFRKRLRNENTGGVGAMWDFLPADTRMPDHSIWQHTALASAIASSIRGGSNVSLAVFSITPVQAFIAKARKLRDHWFSSVILSYLAFIGIRHIAETIGPDHIVYPSLQDQSLVEEWIGKQYGLTKLLVERDATLQKILEDGKNIASFPNKIVFIAPSETVEQICLGAQNAIQAEWERISAFVGSYLGKDESLQKLFSHQVSDYWQYSYAVTKLPKLDEADQLGKLLHKGKWQEEADTISAFAKAYGENGRLTAHIYGAAHSLVQGVLASAKLKPNRIRKSQAGEKCPLCGEHEVLHNLTAPEKLAAADYANGVKQFWSGLQSRFNDGDETATIGKNERLCAICAVKRFLPMLLKKQGLKDELLYSVVSGMESFPSTTQIAAHGYLNRLRSTKQFSKEVEKELINSLHESEVETDDDESSQALKDLKEAGRSAKIEFRDRDKYYVVLLMDGDKMGDLVNGKTMTADWGSVIHPELRKRYDSSSFKPFPDTLKGMLNKKRTINPSLHAAISDSLNSFARFAVAPIVAKSGGRLIYAGGDDVCAIVPLDKALDTADAIRKAYTAGFVRYTADGVEAISDATNAGKIGIHFAKAPGISISAAIVIAHHKEPLRGVLRDAHHVLDGIAKRKAGRNAVAIRLKKRSGGDRDFYCGWDDANPFMAGESTLDMFRNISDDMGELLSSSLMYRLGSLKDAIAPMKDKLEENRGRIVKLFEYEVGHSGLLDKKQKDSIHQIACRLAGITVQDKHVEDSEWFKPETAIIAGFLGRKEQR